MHTHTKIDLLLVAVLSCLPLLKAKEGLPEAPEAQSISIVEHESVVNPTATPKPAEKQIICKDELLGHIKHLSSPALRGREAGTEDQIETAHYISSQFEAFGLKPFGDEKNGESTWYQQFSLARSRGIDTRTAFKVQIGSQDPESLTVGTDFAPLVVSEKPVLTAEAPVVFAGYGISAPEYDYNDFENINLTGKWALILRYEPQEKRKDSKFDGDKLTSYSYLSNKIQQCLMNKACGVLIVTGPLVHEKDDKLPNGKGGAIGDFNAPVFQISRTLAEKILGPSGKTLLDLQTAIDKDLSSQSFEIAGVRINATSALQITPAPTLNVIAKLDGSDPKLKNEYLVIGAHCDHVGLGAEGSLLGKKGLGKIHPGADDNASGTAGLLEIAQAFAQLKLEERPKRSVLFMAFSGEEKGLLGSIYWVNKPKIPLDRIVTMLNLDMIGRSNNDSVQVAGIGTAASFKDLVLKHSNNTTLKINLSSSGEAPSDNTSFYRKNIPVLFFFTGIHPDYHRPSDTWEKINALATMAIAQLAYDIGFEIANAPERPAFTRPAAQGYIGIGPDRKAIQTAKGFPIGSINKDSPAERAGLQVGDLIVKLNNTPVDSAMSLMQGLVSFSAGDKVTLSVQRGVEILTFELTLTSRNK